MPPDLSRPGAPPGHGEGRPPAGAASRDEQLAGGYVTPRVARCVTCRRDPAGRTELCGRCRAALREQLHRRRRAALRLVPLDDGRRDPRERAA